MKRLRLLYRSTIGKKAIVAVTGIIMLGFLIAHVSGNLKVFLPDPEPGVADIDAYAEFLRTVGEPAVPHGGVLWTTRLILLLALVLHVVNVIQLSARNRAARPVQYKKHHLGDPCSTRLYEDEIRSVEGPGAEHVLPLVWASL